MLWSIWPQLGFGYRAFWLILSLVSVCTLFHAAATMVRLRSLMKQGQTEHASSARISLAALQARSANLRQPISAALYLFGLIFFLSLPSDIWRHETGRTTPLMAILGVFNLHCVFAGNVFFVLLVLHSFQWFVSGRVSAARARENS
jgi:hypothetical protein